MNQMVVAEPARARAERIQVYDPIPVLDTGRFEQMVRIAKLMAESNLIPETLCTTYEGTGPGRTVKWLPLNTVVANCFLIVNQAVGWGMDPFAVAQCASVVHGRVCYEGKLIAAVVGQKLGIRLSYAWNDKTGDELGVTVTGKFDNEPTARTVSGTVAMWKTTGNNSPWQKQPRTQLAYRGARDWARLHAPAVILGVYSIDEMEGAIARQERMPAARSMMIEGASDARPTPPKPTPPEPATVAKEPTPAAPKPIVVTSGRLPPNPNRAASAPPKPQEPPKPKPFDFDAFRAALNAATTAEEADAIYQRDIAARAKPLTDDEMDECDRILRECTAQFWTENDNTEFEDAR